MLEQLKQNAIRDMEKAENSADLDNIERKYFGRQGELTNFLRSLGTLSEQEKKEQGRLANQIKNDLAEKINQAKKRFAGAAKMEDKDDWLDITAPGIKAAVGHLHPLALVQREVEKIFQEMGFSVVYGPEMETERYNFDALNVPKDHPARDVWDTFWLKPDAVSGSRSAVSLLRTHTSPVQARYMEKHRPPLRIIAPGRCFRHEATDASHDAQFYQVEGLMVGDNISVANFKAIVEQFFKSFFGKEAEARLRPSYFPFVEPGFEIDLKQPGKDWLEIMGAGMVHPNVFKAVGYQASAGRRSQGFAFGVGLDRLAMLKYQINDIRLFYNGDLRFINQF